MTPETCRVTWQWINVCILLHRVGPLLTLNMWHVWKRERIQDRILVGRAEGRRYKTHA